MISLLKKIDNFFRRLILQMAIIKFILVIAIFQLRSLNFNLLLYLQEFTQSNIVGVHDTVITEIMVSVTAIL